ncbi:MAG: hypothetical protein IJ131_00650, partial [Eggerthellaceae bacterium]|nr:hypothetical protein [Eggerthellaceae bacterium]
MKEIANSHILFRDMHSAHGVSTCWLCMAFQPAVFAPVLFGCLILPLTPRTPKVSYLASDPFSLFVHAFNPP